MTSNASLSQLLHVSTLCHTHHIPFISADVWGVWSNVFVDFGPQWTVRDPDDRPSLFAIVVGVQRVTISYKIDTAK